MRPEGDNRLPEVDPVTTAAIGVTVLLLVAWFVWNLVSPPGPRVSPSLRAQPIPPNFGAPLPFSGRPRPNPPPGIPFPPGVGGTTTIPAPPSSSTAPSDVPPGLTPGR